MATGRLTWQNVAAPDFSGAVEAQRASALAFDNAMQRLGGAVKTFDNNRKDRADATVLRNAMQYQNADDLQAAIASGALMEGVNPDHVRVDALLKAQNQVGYHTALAKDRQQLATSEQLYEFNKLRNPQLLDEGRLAIATAQQTLDQNADLHAPKVALAKTQAASAAFALGKDQTEFGRKEEDFAANRAAANRVAAMQASGEYYDPQAVSRLYSSLGESDPVHRAMRKAIATDYPDLVKNFSAVGSYTGQGTQIPTGTLAGIGGVQGAPTPSLQSVPGMNSPEAGAFAARALKQNPLLQTFIQGLGALETGHGNNKTIGSNNAFNIKDFSGQGPRALDKAEGSFDSYRNFDSPEAAQAELITTLARKYPAALTATTPEEFASALHNGVGGAKYATDPQHAEKVANTINSMLRKATTPAQAAPTPPTPAVAPASTLPTPPAASPAPAAATAPAVPAPAAGQLTPENAAILARVTQQTLGLGQSAGNTAELSSFAAAAADKKTSFEEAGKSIIEAFPGLDRRDVDSMLTQVQAMHPMLRSPAAAAFVIKNTPKTSAWYDPFNWGNNIRLDKSAIETKVAELTKPEAVKTGVLANEVSTNIGTKVAESEKKLTATTDSILVLQEQLRNAAPGSARANALQSEVTRLEGKAAEYRSQIDSRSAQEKALTEELMRAADPELYAKQQKEAEKRKAAAAAADAAMSKKTTTPAAEPEAQAPRWKRNMTQAEVDELRQYEEFKKTSAKQKAAAAKQAEQAAKATTAAEIEKEAAALTVNAIRNMTLPQLQEVVGSRAFSKLTKEQRNELIARRQLLAAGG